MDPYLTMALNNAWANATLYAALKPLSREAFAARRPGFFPSLQETLNHIHAVDLFYIDALEEGGRGRSVYDREDIAEITALARAQAAADDRLARFCAALKPDDLNRRVRTERAHDPQAAETIGALLLHLFQHQVHHRGQAHVQLQDAGIAPPQLDDFHLEDGRAETARPYFQ